MRKPSDSTLLYRIAKHYYIDRKSQQEIADLENISRSQISRLLSRAIDEGIVTYNISLPDQENFSNLNLEVMCALNLRNVILIPSHFEDTKSVDEHDQTKNLALGAAEHINELIKPYKNVGIGWGKSIYLTSLYLSRNGNDSLSTFVPLIGISGDRNPYLQINSIVDRFSEKLNGDRIYINLLALNNSFESYTEYEKRNLEHLKEYWDNLDVAIIGIGNPPIIAKTLIYEFSPDYLKKIRSSKAVGDILSHFYFNNGKVLNLEMSYSLVAYKIDKLKEMKEVIAIAAGESKVEAIIAAANARYFKTLITDYDTAQAIMDRLKK